LDNFVKNKKKTLAPVIFSVENVQAAGCWKVATLGQTCWTC